MSLLHCNTPSDALSLRASKHDLIFNAEAVQIAILNSYGAYSFKSSTAHISIGRKSSAPSTFITASLDPESRATTCACSPST